MINPAWFALDQSRGIETPGSKLYMRLTVLVLDYLIYIPALWMFTNTWHGERPKRTQVSPTFYAPPNPELTS